MIRVAGCFFVIGATTLWGMDKSKRLKSQYEHMKYLQRIICLLKSEIRYSRSFLGEIFYQIGQSVEEPYRTWLFDLTEKTKNHSAESFEEIWRESIDTYLKEIQFSAYEMETLKALGSQIGFADVEVQLKLLDIYLEHLQKSMEELRDEIQTKTKIYHCLGVMSGILVSVLLL